MAEMLEFMPNGDVILILTRRVKAGEIPEDQRATSRPRANSPPRDLDYSESRIGERSQAPPLNEFDDNVYYAPDPPGAEDGPAFPPPPRAKRGSDASSRRDLSASPPASFWASLRKQAHDISALVDDDDDDELASVLSVPAEKAEEVVVVAQKEVHCLVSSMHLMLASEYFCSILGGDTREASVLKNKGHITMRLGVDLDSMEILLNIIHGASRKIPRQVTLELLTQLAILVAGFGMSGTVEFFSDTWIDNLTRQGLPKSYSSRIFPYLFIFWVFNRQDEFRDMTRLAERDATEKLGEDLGELPILSGIIDAIKKARESAIRAAVSSLHSLINRYLVGKTLCDGSLNDELRYACDAMVLGSLMKSSRKFGIYPMPDAPFSGWKFKTLAKKIRSIRILDVCNKSSSRRWTTYEPGNNSHGLEDEIEQGIKNLEKTLDGLRISDYARTSTDLMIKFHNLLDLSIVEGVEPTSVDLIKFSETHEELQIFTTENEMVSTEVIPTSTGNHHHDIFNDHALVNGNEIGIHAIKEEEYMEDPQAEFEALVRPKQELYWTEDHMGGPQTHGHVATSSHASPEFARNESRDSWDSRTLASHHNEQSPSAGSSTVSARSSRSGWTGQTNDPSQKSRFTPADSPTIPNSLPRGRWEDENIELRYKQILRDECDNSKPECRGQDKQVLEDLSTERQRDGSASISSRRPQVRWNEGINDQDVERERHRNNHPAVPERRSSISRRNESMQVEPRNEDQNLQGSTIPPEHARGIRNEVELPKAEVPAYSLEAAPKISSLTEHERRGRRESRMSGLDAKLDAYHNYIALRQMHTSKDNSVSKLKEIEQPSTNTTLPSPIQSHHIEQNLTGKQIDTMADNEMSRQMGQLSASQNRCNNHLSEAVVQEPQLQIRIKEPRVEYQGRNEASNILNIVPYRNYSPRRESIKRKELTKESDYPDPASREYTRSPLGTKAPMLVRISPPAVEKLKQEARMEPRSSRDSGHQEAPRSPVIQQTIDDFIAAPRRPPQHISHQPSRSSSIDQLGRHNDSHNALLEEVRTSPHQSPRQSPNSTHEKDQRRTSPAGEEIKIATKQALRQSAVIHRSAPDSSSVSGEPLARNSATSPVPSQLQSSPSQGLNSTPMVPKSAAITQVHQRNTQSRDQHSPDSVRQPNPTNGRNLLSKEQIKGGGDQKADRPQTFPDSLRIGLTSPVPEINAAPKLGSIIEIIEKAPSRETVAKEAPISSTSTTSTKPGPYPPQKVMNPTLSSNEPNITDHTPNALQLAAPGSNKNITLKPATKPEKHISIFAPFTNHLQRSSSKDDEGTIGASNDVGAADATTEDKEHDLHWAQQSNFKIRKSKKTFTTRY